MTEDHKPFWLECWQVPAFPASPLWSDQLRWILAVMDHDDPDLGFVASLLVHVVRRGGLTQRQQPYASKIIARVQRMWREGRLRAQVPPPEQQADGASSLADLDVGGEA